MGDGILRSAGGTGASGNSRRHLRCMKEAGISYTMKPYIRSGYEVPHDAHAEPPLILLQLNHLGDRREQHMVKLVKLSVSGSFHPAMTLLFYQLLHGAISVPHSRTALGKRRPSVVGAITFN